MIVSEYIANWVATISPRVYGVCGAGAMHLNDAIAHHPGIRFLPMHHEQAASFAAEADARVSGKPGIVHVTSGPGVTNVVTGVACAWADSIPMIVIAGQAETRTLRGEANLRQRGVSEVDGVAIMFSITKYAVRVASAIDVPTYLAEALYFATTGRPGPVYLEIPLDIQNSEIGEQEGFPVFPTWPRPLVNDLELAQFTRMLRAASRPVLIVGNGVRLSGACERMLRVIDALQIPVLTTWNASDIVASNHPCNIGRFGLFGDRAGNFTVQNADLIISIGARLSIPQVGHHPELFAPNAKRIVVDIDHAEANKDYLHADLPIVADAGEFLAAMLKHGVHHSGGRWPEWKARCLQWKLRYPVMLPEHREDHGGVNAYDFMRELSRHIDDDAIIVTDVGTAFVCSQQAMQLTGKQRLFHASGIAPMGYGLPAAIGACLAGGGRQVVCICGDGGMMFNLQELATIAHHDLPIIIFVLANGGYRTMQVTQGNHFGRETAASESSGVMMPNFMSIASTLINAMDIDSDSYLEEAIAEILGGNIPHFKGCNPVLCEVHMASGQQITPRVQSRMENGTFVPVPPEDMYPYLDRAELVQNMQNDAMMLEATGASA